MGKEWGFGGLPDSLFATMVADFQNTTSNPLNLRAGSAEAGLAAIASAEHAMAKSATDPNVSDYIFACLAVQNAFNDLKKNGDDTKGVYLGGLQGALVALQQLFP